MERRCALGLGRHRELPPPRTGETEGRGKRMMSPPLPGRAMTHLWRGWQRQLMGITRLDSDD